MTRSIGLALLALLLVATGFLAAPPREVTAQNGAIPLAIGGNSIGYGGATAPVADSLGELAASVTVVWFFDSATQSWISWSPALPAALRGFAELRFGEAYFLFTTAAAEWSPPAAAVAPATTLVELDAGVNHVAYFGEPRDVTEAVASIGEALSGVWQFHGPTQSWRLWSSSLPAALRGFDTFADGSAYFFILDRAATWTLGDPPIGMEVADDLVLEQLAPPDVGGSDMIIFRHPQLLQAGDAVTPGRSNSGGDGGLFAEEPSFLYWVDRFPGARFGHPTEFVLVGAISQTVRRSTEEWWPALNGEPLFTGPGEYWDPSTWAFSRLQGTTVPDAPAAALSAALAAPIPSAEDPPDSLRAAQTTLFGEPSASCALVVNGWTDGELDADFGLDFDRARTFFQGNGFAMVTTLETPNNTPLEFGQAIDQLATNDGCTNITIYISTHGSPNAVALGGENMPAQDFVDLLDSYDRDFSLIVDACYSGSLIDEFDRAERIEFTATATDGVTFAWGDVDEKNGIEDRNPLDVGGEFSSGFFPSLEGLIDQLTADEEMRGIWNTWAADAGVSLLTLAYHCAFSQALVFDLTWVAGETAPQRSSDADASPCTVVWTSAFPSTEAESSDFSHTWRITLTQSTPTALSGSISFHSFPGGGRARYVVNADGVLGSAKIAVPRTTPSTAIGPLGQTAERQPFELLIGHTPDPNLVGTSDLTLSDLEIRTFPVTVGETASFSFTVRNNGPELAGAVEVVFTIEGVNATLSNPEAFPGACDRRSSGIVCDLGRFRSSQEGSFTVDLNPGTAGDLRLSARLRSSSRDPVPLNNVDTTTLLIREPEPPGDE